MTSSLARVRFHLAFARPTLDLAAPLELALAPFGDDRPPGLVAATAAHETAAVHGRRVPVAFASGGAESAGAGGVGAAEVRRAGGVDEVLARRTREVTVGADEPRALRVEGDLRRPVVAVAQPVADLAVRRQLVPARAQTARTGYAVALAADLRVVVHRLRTDREWTS